MTTHWMAVALLSAGLVIGCGSGQSTEIAETETALAPQAEDSPAPDAGTVSPGVDTRTSAPRRPAPPAPAPPAPAASYRELRVDAGTAVPLELLTALSSETTAVEAPVRARLREAITADGYTVLPAGTEFAGTVTEVVPPGRVKGLARVSVIFTQAIVAGASEPVATEPVTFEGEATRGEDATKIGVGAGIGAAIGGILGGGSGAAKGAAIGGAAGTGAVLATRGQHVQVAGGADVAARLAEPFELRVRVN